MFLTLLNWGSQSASHPSTPMIFLRICPQVQRFFTHGIYFDHQNKPSHRPSPRPFKTWTSTSMVSNATLPLQKQYHPKWPLVVAVHEKRWWALEVRPPWNLPNASADRRSGNGFGYGVGGWCCFCPVWSVLKYDTWLKFMVVNDRSWETDYNQIHEVGRFTLHEPPLSLIPVTCKRASESPFLQSPIHHFHPRSSHKSKETL